MVYEVILDKRILRSVSLIIHICLQCEHTKQTLSALLCIRILPRIRFNIFLSYIKYKILYSIDN